MRSFFLFLLLTVYPTCFAFVGGNGTEGDPYQINTCQDIQAIANNLSASYVLVNNIDCSATRSWNNGQGFIPVGDHTNNPFAGTFDGNGFQVRQVYINRLSSTGGIFQYNTGIIKNVNVVDVDMTAQDLVAALVATNRGTVDHCSSSGKIVDLHDSAAGGLIATNELGLIQNSSSSANVQGIMSVGGLVGYNSGRIINNYATGQVSGQKRYIGGLVGLTGGSAAADQSQTLQATNGDVMNSYATGRVIGVDDSVGGLVGYSINVKVAGCYSIGFVQATGSSGGLIGKISNTKVISAYYNSDTSGQRDTGKGTPYSTAQMFQQANYIGWDFVNTWQPPSGNDYPHLRM